MKNLLWVLVMLCGFISSCQTGRYYAGTTGWGKYAASAEASGTVSASSNPEVLTASAFTGISVERNPGVALYNTKPGSNAKVNSEEVTPVNPPKTRVSHSPEVTKSKHLPEPVQIAQPRQIHKFAIAGLAVSALAFLPFVAGISLFFGLPLALAGAWMSRRAIRQIKADPENYRGLGLAKAGFGIAVVVLALLLLFGIAALVVG